MIKRRGEMYQVVVVAALVIHILECFICLRPIKYL